MPRKSIKQDVEGCEFHTARDQRGDLIRTGPCNGFCRIHAQLQGKLPLTEFLKKLAGYTDEQVAAADAGLAAKVYGIKREYAIGYITMEREQRGIRVGRTGGILASGKPGKRVSRKVAAHA